jgi:hypothetical protein
MKTLTVKLKLLFFKSREIDTLLISLKKNNMKMFLQILNMINAGIKRSRKNHMSFSFWNKLYSEAENFRINWIIMSEHKEFFNELFSTYYSFNESELIKFSDKLSIGSPFLVLDNGATHLDTIFGLIYNKNILWTANLKAIYYKEPELIYAGSTDEYSHKIDFDKLPLSLLDGVKHEKAILQNSIIDNYGYSEENKYYDELSNKLDIIKKHYNTIISKLFFSNNELIEIIKGEKRKYIFNKHIYYRLIKIIYRDVPDFSLDKFYEMF